MYVEIKKSMSKFYQISLNRKMVAIIIFLFCIFPALSFAEACKSVGSTSADLGSYPSYSVIDFEVEGKSKLPSSGMKCDLGSLLSVIQLGDFIKVKYLGSTSLLSHTQDPSVTIPFALYIDESMGNPLLPGRIEAYSFAKLLDLLGILGGSKTLDMPMYIQLETLEASKVIAGTYTAVINLEWEWRLCKGIGILGICIGSDTGKNVVSTLMLNLNIEPDCRISADDINFGEQPFITEFDAQEGVINITCTKGTSYKVGISDGDHYSAGVRNMKALSGDKIAYNIYKGVTRDVWGGSGVGLRDSKSAEINAGAGLGNVQQGFKYTAEIVPGQEAKPEGLYKDYLRINVIF